MAKKKAKSKRKPNPAFMKALKPSAALAAIVGDKPLPRTQAVKKIWDYIKRKGLQDKVNRRNINCDDVLAKVVGKSKCSMFDLAKMVSKNLS
ncbi:MAG TPA: DNA topoisomerase III [Planctomycetes bacterium]|nr:DNA topoisomerase III [Planctomycetota bacterium]